jgi:hypothetical protein
VDLLLPAGLNPAPDGLSPSVRTIRLGAGISDNIVLPVKAGNKHGTIVLITAWLIGRK